MAVKLLGRTGILLPLAQSGFRALVWGAGGRWFKSSMGDQTMKYIKQFVEGVKLDSQGNIRPNARSMRALFRYERERAQQKKVDKPAASS